MVSGGLRRHSPEVSRPLKLYCIVTPGHSHHLRRTGPAYEKRTLPHPPHPTHPPHPSQPSPRLRLACTDRVSPPPSRCRRASRAEGVSTRGLSVRRRRGRDTAVGAERSTPPLESPPSSLLPLPSTSESSAAAAWPAPLPPPSGVLSSPAAACGKCVHRVEGGGGAPPRTRGAAATPVLSPCSAAASSSWCG